MPAAPPSSPLPTVDGGRIVTIARLGSGGDGVVDVPAGEPNAPLEYVPFALPGETWRLAGGAAPQLILAAPDRRAPLCPHYQRCGGCLAQHMPAALYASWKVQTLVDAFAHRGLDISPEPLVMVPPNSRRRATFAAERIPGGSPGAGDIVLGFHRAESHRIEPISACAVLSPQIVAALPGLAALADIAMSGAAPAKSSVRRGKLATRSATPPSLRLAVLATDTGLTIDIMGTPAKLSSTALAAGPRARLAEIAIRHGFAVVSLDGDVIVKRGQARLAIAGVMVEPPPGSFVQAAAAAEAQMVEIVLAAVGNAKRVADLFSGLGTFTFALARRAPVLAVDSEASLLAVLRHGFAHAQGLKPVEAKQRDLMLEPLSPKELEPFDAVVFDPPRAGAQAQAERIARSKVAVAVAVSCNPATLARDARALIDGGFKLERVAPIDQFAFTPHLEAVAVFKR